MDSSRHQDKLASYARITPITTDLPPPNTFHHRQSLSSSSSSSRQVENNHYNRHHYPSSASPSFSVASSRARDAPKSSPFFPPDSSRDHRHSLASPIEKTTQRDNLRYSLKVFQQPCKARMVGHGDRADRRPVDPPPVIKLEMSDITQGETKGAEEQILLRSPHFICYSTLCQPNPPYEELFSTPHSGKPYMVGSFVSSSVHLRDDYEVVPKGHYFLFCDVGVRVEGVYRLKFSVFEIVDHKVILCATTMSEKFQVFSAKNFPGMERKTEISEILSQQGVRMRQRKKTNHIHTTIMNNDKKQNINNIDDNNTSLEINNKIKAPQKMKSVVTTTRTTPIERYIPPLAPPLAPPPTNKINNSKRKPIEGESKKKYRKKSTNEERSLVPLTRLVEVKQTTATANTTTSSSMSPISHHPLPPLPISPAELIHIPDIKIHGDSITRIIPSIHNMLLFNNEP